MKRNLLLCTASDERVRRLLDNGLYEPGLMLIISEQRKTWIKSDYPDVELLTTHQDYIDYYELKNNDLITTRLWDEVWLLISGSGSCWDYTDGLCIVSELKYRKMCFIDAYGNVTIIDNSILKQLTGIITDTVIMMCFVFFQKTNQIWSLIMGYKW